jgi:hypothetical protein
MGLMGPPGRIGIQGPPGRQGERGRDGIPGVVANDFSFYSLFADNLGEVPQVLQPIITYSSTDDKYLTSVTVQQINNTVVILLASVGVISKAFVVNGNMGSYGTGTIILPQNAMSNYFQINVRWT